MKNRNGSYKKILMTPDFLVSELPFLKQNTSALFSAELSDVELCTLYILLFLRVRHRKNWLQKSSNHKCQTSSNFILDKIPESFALNDWEKTKLKNVNLEELFLNFNLKGIPQSVNRTMLHWLRREWSIKLLTYIPSPRELLQLQVNKGRCITLTKDEADLGTLILSSRDPLSFVLHDLMHADQFFNHREIINGQLGFYRKVESIYDQAELMSALKKDKTFKKEFEYVAADMNAYVIHLFKCFKSAFIKTDQQLFIKLLDWWSLNDVERVAAHHLNTPDFSPEDELILKQFFEYGVLA